MPGRPSDPIWKFFAISERDGKTVAVCLSCQQHVSRKVLRLKNHQKICTGAAASTSTTTPAIARSAVAIAETESPDGDDISIITTTPVTKRRKTEQKIDGYVVKTPATKKTELDQLWADAFYACNIPFNVIEHPRFREAVEITRPGYQLPNRKQLGMCSYKFTLAYKYKYI